MVLLDYLVNHLADIAGKPMIERVYDRVSQATKTACTIVATDDDRVYSAVQQFGGNCYDDRP